MNRWQIWARRLRQRHSRIDAWRAQGAMPLLRGAGAAVPGVRNDLRLVVHMHTRLANSPRFMLSLQPAVVAPMMLRQTALGGSARSAAHSEFATGTASWSPTHAASLLSPGIVAAPAFVPRMNARARAMLLPPQSAPVHLSMGHREIASPVAAHAGETASRLRRNAARHELPSSPPAAVLATPHRAGAHAAATEAQAVVQAAAARQHAEEARLAASAPAINVEALTGIVIQQIDHRLVAYRERMGRG